MSAKSDDESAEKKQALKLVADRVKAWDEKNRVLK